MDLLDYLRAFRRHWLVITATIAVAMGTAWLTSETIAPVTPSAPTYQATALLASGGTSIDGVPLTPDTLSVFLTIDPVAARAKKLLDFEGDTEILQQRVQGTPDANTGVFLSITGFGPSAREAEDVAGAFAGGLIDYLRDRQTRSLTRQIERLEEQIQEAREEGDLEAVSALNAELALLEQEATAAIGVSVFERGKATEVGTSGFQPPDSPFVRLGIAALIGLLAGAAIALLLDRVDTKIRTSEQATEHFGSPVLAEIPSIPRDQRKGVVASDHPTSAGADAFRLLGAGVNVAGRPLERNDDGGRRGRIVLVTSSGPAEGKTSVVANLAAVLAEEGNRVIAFSADLRRPKLHQVLRTESTPGLTQAARDPSPGIRRYRQLTHLNHVLVVPSGGPTERPGEVLASSAVRTLLGEAREMADWVVVDTAPILVAGESAPLVDEADLVLVVARVGTISKPVAERTRETLHRLGADGAWVVLNGARPRTVPGGYHRYQVQAQRDVKKRDRSSKGNPG